MQITRERYVEQLVKQEGNGLVKIVTGLRRVGKSYLLDPLYKENLLRRGVAEDHIIKIAFDIPSNKDLLNAEELYKFIQSKLVDRRKYYILQDEVQLVDEFVSVLNGLLRIPNVEVVVTGSNSRFLSSDIATEFRGRGTEIRVYPLDFAEFMSVYPGDRLTGWREYYTYGGLPAVVLEPEVELKMRYLAEQIRNVYINDIVERNKIKNDTELRILIEVLASSIGAPTNPTKLANTFKSKGYEIDRKTVAQYLQYLEEAFIVERARKYDLKGKKYIDTPQKYYFTDVGVRNYLLRYRQMEETHIMENIVYLELRRRRYEVDVGMVEVRERKGDVYQKKQLEIDFVARKGNETVYIQSALSLPTAKKVEQEERSLLKVKDSFKKMIVTQDNIVKHADEEGVVFVNLMDFLVGDVM